MVPFHLSREVQARDVLFHCIKLITNDTKNQQQDQKFKNLQNNIRTEPILTNRISFPNKITITIRIRIPLVPVEQNLKLSVNKAYTFIRN